MKATGWIPDLPDLRDKLYQDFFKALATIKFPVRGWWPPWGPKGTIYPATMDLRDSNWLPIFDQGSLGSCVENAWCAALAFIEAKEGKTNNPYSRLFLYYNVRGGVAVDFGSSIRSGIKSVAKQGVCNESLWAYDLSQWINKPPDAAYAEALPRKDIQYARLITLDDMLHCLATGYPIVYGMSLYDPFGSIGADGKVPMPTGKENYIGGHSMCIVGYDQNARLFLVRNSWGTGWGMQGYCWIPFDYLLNPLLADDFWTCRSIPVTP